MARASLGCVVPDPVGRSLSSPLRFGRLSCMPAADTSGLLVGSPPAHPLGTVLLLRGGSPGCLQCPLPPQGPGRGVHPAAPLCARLGPQLGPLSLAPTGSSPSAGPTASDPGPLCLAQYSTAAVPAMSPACPYSLASSSGTGGQWSGDRSGGLCPRSYDCARGPRWPQMQLAAWLPHGSGRMQRPSAWRLALW